MNLNRMARCGSKTSRDILKLSFNPLAYGPFPSACVGQRVPVVGVFLGIVSYPVPVLISHRLLDIGPPGGAHQVPAALSCVCFGCFQYHPLEAHSVRSG